MLNKTIQTVLNSNQQPMENITNEKYPDGYLPKIQYWTGKLSDELNNTKVPNLELISEIHQKLDYFIQREWDNRIVVI